MRTSLPLIGAVLFAFYCLAPGEARADDRAVYALTPDGTVLRYLGHSGSWTPIGGGFGKLVAGGGRLFGLRAGGDIHELRRGVGEGVGPGEAIAAAGWVRIGGPGYQFVVDARGRLSGISPGQAGVYRYEDVPDQWTRIGGPMAELLISGPELYGRGVDGSALRYDGIPDHWTPLGPAVTQLVFDGPRGDTASAPPPPPPTSAHNVAGRWLWQCCSGNYTGTLTLQQAGERIWGSFDDGGTHDPVEGQVQGYDVHFKRRFSGHTQDYTLKLNPGCGVMIGPFLGDRDLAQGNDFRAVTPTTTTNCADRDAAIRLIGDSSGGKQLLASFHMGGSVAKDDGVHHDQSADNGAPRRVGPCFYTSAQHHRCTGVPYDMRLDTGVDQVCNACLEDKHCTEHKAGRCVRTTGGGCGHDSGACAYPGDPCYDRSPTGTCPNDGFCWNINGRATCGPIPTSPP